VDVLRALGRRWWVAVAAAVGSAAVAGAAIGVVSSGSGGGTDALVPTFSESPTETSTPSASPTPTTASPTASHTPSPTPSHTPSPSPTPSRTPSPTVAPTSPTPTATVRQDLATVILDNATDEAAKVSVGKGTWIVPARTKQTVRVTPDPGGNDFVSVASVAHPTCGRADAGLYFEAGKTYRVAMTPTPGCTIDGKDYTYPGFEVVPG
jgi:hypothetical protein